MKRILFIVLSLILVYFSLFFAGRQAIVPRNKALSLINDAGRILLTSATTSATLQEEISQLKEAVYLYKQAENIDLNNFPIIKGYVSENYKLCNDIISYDEALLSQEIKYSKDDHKKRMEEYTKRMNDITNAYGSYNRTHLWMKLIFLD